MGYRSNNFGCFQYFIVFSIIALVNIIVFAAKYLIIAFIIFLVAFWIIGGFKGEEWKD